MHWNDPSQPRTVFAGVSCLVSWLLALRHVLAVFMPTWICPAKTMENDRQLLIHDPKPVFSVSGLLRFPVKPPPPPPSLCMRFYFLCSLLSLGYPYHVPFYIFYHSLIIFFTIFVLHLNLAGGPHIFVFSFLLLLSFTISILSLSFILVSTYTDNSLLYKRVWHLITTLKYIPFFFFFFFLPSSSLFLRHTIFSRELEPLATDCRLSHLSNRLALHLLR